MSGLHNWWDGSQNKEGQMTLKDHYGEGMYGNSIGFLPLVGGVTAGAVFDPFITNYSDNWTSDWNSEHVFGRSDPIYTWKSTGRSISLGFKTVAASFKEAYSNMCNIQRLQKMLYPYYYAPGSGLATTIAKAPLIRLRWANLIMNNKNANVNNGSDHHDDGTFYNHDDRLENGLLGVIKSLSCTPDLDEGMIEGPGAGVLYPKVWNISLSFGVLHENILGWTTEMSTRSETQVEAGSQRPGTITESRVTWIGDTAPGDETGYPYGVASNHCLPYEAQGDGIGVTAVSTSTTPNKDALIEEAEIVQESLTSFDSLTDRVRVSRNGNLMERDNIRSARFASAGSLRSANRGY